MCSAARLNEGKEAFLEDVKDSGEEEGQSQEDEQLVRQLPPVVLEDQLPAQVDGSSHVLKLLVGFQHCPGGGGQCADGVLTLLHLFGHHPADRHQTLCDVAVGFY